MPLAFFSNLDGGKWREITTFAKYFLERNEINRHIASSLP